MTRWLVGCLAIATACGSSDGDRQASLATCRATGDELARYLRSVDLEPRTFLSQVHLAERSLETTKDIRGYPVQLSIDHVIGSRGDVSIAELHSELDIAKRAHPARPDDTHAALAIDAATPWSAVTAVFRELDRAGIDNVDLVVATSPVKVAPPAASKVDAQLDAISAGDAADRATKLAKITSDVVSTCPPLIKLFGRVGSEEGGSKTDALIGGLPAALVACDCDADIDSLRAVFYRILHDDHPVAAIAIQLRPGARKLGLAPTTPWRDVAKTLAAGPIDPAQ